MATIVSFHAHPDDESIASAGTLARAAAAGHRVVLVFATRGELGEPVPGVLEPGEQLAMRRSAECYASAAVIGAKRVEFLGYTDSGMIGEPSNDAPFCFWQADVEHAAKRLAVILDEEEPDVLTVYDDNGGYGHPDHIQVHRVGRRAAELSAVPVVAQGTINRDWMIRGLKQSGAELPENLPTMGKPEAEITHRVDAVDFVDQKRASMRAHASQMGPDHFMLTMPDAMFALGMGTEFYIVDPPPNPASAPDVFEELFISLH
ncbi:PIG-L family deacetylase [Pseudonocardia sp. KRD-184]|uniref:PIG-L family deacetylase n=1 Tax=Pseudonocardia oceani TaxID=2792013 RepID=A0ABS6UCJ5_9PSEU|nr:PIG-L family deacetylase [Pseudonocardia oceani]MBW0092150.1 PIG-L family deacetylase [Pseudonocardia oceani]MBW0097275.1 PIG-L family deacetylase [Pseudonocardia oceani]MBW0107899.1 PIG-L family deacetylase [Pseudonocardia oceani]MBW0121273.1 PIG-L family deacetylase [Pseudonocardia oceani]MBW0129966.1 PIG-L family deacetylase [Pseudonocardia oceani]